jgi:hypothetical protein
MERREALRAGWSPSGASQLIALATQKL